MQHNVYANYSEKFVKNVILYAEEDKGKLFFDELYTQEVYEDSLNNFFNKGLLISFEDSMYTPIKISKNSVTDKTEVKVFNGTTTYTFVSEILEEPEEIEEPEDIEITPTIPTFNDSTGVITIPVKEGVIYKIDDEELESGEQEPIDKDTDVTVVAIPDDGYKFSAGSTTEWTFQWTD